jgi:CxxC-x17-CxxC domain-containing protein
MDNPFFSRFAYQFLQNVLTVVIPALIVIVAGTFLLAYLKRFTFDMTSRRFVNASRRIGDLQRMTPTEFEHFCRMLFEKQGYKVHVTAPQNDGGVDIVGAKEGVRIVAQCKRYASRNVGRPALQQFYGTFEDNRAERGYFLTTSNFATMAREFAASKPITLIDRKELARWINRYASGDMEEESPPEQHHQAICAACGQPAVLSFKPVTGKPVYCRTCYAARRKRGRR